MRIVVARRAVKATVCYKCFSFLARRRDRLKVRLFAITSCTRRPLESHGCRIMCQRGRASKRNSFAAWRRATFCVIVRVSTKGRVEGTWHAAVYAVYGLYALYIEPWVPTCAPGWVLPSRPRKTTSAFFPHFSYRTALLAQRSSITRPGSKSINASRDNVSTPGTIAPTRPAERGSKWHPLAVGGRDRGINIDYEITKCNSRRSRVCNAINVRIIICRAAAKCDRRIRRVESTLPKAAFAVEGRNETRSLSFFRI